MFWSIIMFYQAKKCRRFLQLFAEQTEVNPEEEHGSRRTCQSISLVVAAIFITENSQKR